MLKQAARPVRLYLEGPGGKYYNAFLVQNGDTSAIYLADPIPQKYMRGDPYDEAEIWVAVNDCHTPGLWHTTAAEVTLAVAKKEESLLITNIRLFKKGADEMVEITVEKCLNETKLYTLYGHPEIISKSLAAGNVEIMREMSYNPATKTFTTRGGDIRQRGNAKGELKFEFKKPDTESFFYIAAGL